MAHGAWRMAMVMVMVVHACTVQFGFGGKAEALGGNFEIGRNLKLAGIDSTQSACLLTWHDKLAGE
jgi:hypothetical protein